MHVVAINICYSIQSRKRLIGVGRQLRELMGFPLKYETPSSNPRTHRKARCACVTCNLSVTWVETGRPLKLIGQSVMPIQQASYSAINLVSKNKCGKQCRKYTLHGSLGSKHRRAHVHIPILTNSHTTRP